MRLWYVLRIWFYQFWVGFGSVGLIDALLPFGKCGRRSRICDFINIKTENVEINWATRIFFAS